jgi:hypothetical protein
MMTTPTKDMTTLMASRGITHPGTEEQKYYIIGTQVQLLY